MTKEKVDIVEEFVIKDKVLQQYIGSSETVVIPDGINVIGAGAFCKNKTLREIIMPDSVTCVENWAFSSCTALRKVAFSKRLRITGIYAFSGCTSLEDVELPQSLASVNYGAFKGCTSLKKVTISEGTKRISIGAFAKCTALREIEIPDSMKEIKRYAFSKCSNLKRVTFHTKKACRIDINSFYKTAEGLSFSWPNQTVYRKEMEDGFCVQGDCLKGYFGNAERIRIPEKVREIAPYAFSDNRCIKHVEVPGNVKAVGKSAFAFMQELLSIAFEGVTDLGESCFWASMKLEKLMLPSCLKTVGNDCFGNTHSLSDIDLSHTEAELLGRIAPMSKGLMRFRFPKKTRTIPFCAFYCCSALTDVVIPETVEEIAKNAFYSCKSLVTVIIPSGVKCLHLNVFDSCDALKEIVMQSRETEIAGRTDEFCTAAAHYADEPRIRQAVIFMGIQGSGKTYYYNWHFKGKFEHVNLDTLQTRKKERAFLENCINQGMDFVVDNTNPTREDREYYIRTAKQAGYRIIGYYFESKLRDCIDRNNQRSGKARIPEKAIAATSNKLEIPSWDEGFDELYYVEHHGSNVTLGSNPMLKRDWKAPSEVNERGEG